MNLQMKSSFKNIFWNYSYGHFICQNNFLKKVHMILKKKTFNLWTCVQNNILYLEIFKYEKINLRIDELLQLNYLIILEL
jgi:hypothetical protein